MDALICTDAQFAGLMAAMECAFQSSAHKLTCQDKVSEWGVWGCVVDGTQVIGREKLALIEDLQFQNLRFRCIHKMKCSLAVPKCSK